jgi:hypothetical protein
MDTLHATQSLSGLGPASFLISNLSRFHVSLARWRWHSCHLTQLAPPNLECCCFELTFLNVKRERSWQMDGIRNKPGIVLPNSICLGASANIFPCVGIGQPRLFSKCQLRESRGREKQKLLHKKINSLIGLGCCHDEPCLSRGALGISAASICMCADLASTRSSVNGR